MKKFLGLVTASVLAFGLVACGTDSAKERTEANTDSAATEATAESTDGQTYKVGVIQFVY